MVKTDLDGRVRWTANGWYLFAERTPQFDPGRDGPAFERVLSRLAATKGIARVIRPQDFRALGIPDYDDNPYARGHVIVAADADFPPRDRSNVIVLLPATQGSRVSRPQILA
jgi:hypothetical protein